MTTLTQKTYADTTNAITFRDSGGTAVLTLQNLPYGSGRVSAQYDRGAGAKSCLYEVLVVGQWEDHPAASDALRVAVIDHDGTLIPGTLGTADAAVTVEGKLTQGQNYQTTVLAEAAAGSTNRIAKGYAMLHQRYVSVAPWNASLTKNLKNSPNVSYIRLTPIVEVVTDA